MDLKTDIFDQAGTFENDDYKTEKLIKEKGRRLYEAADERNSLAWQAVADTDYDIHFVPGHTLWVVKKNRNFRI